MTNSLYPLWKQALMREIDITKSLDQTSPNNPAVALLTVVGGYTYSDMHQFYSDLSSIVGTPQPLTSNTVSGNIFNAQGVVFTAVTGRVDALAIYRQNSGASSTWKLVAYLDSNIIGLPIISNGGNLLIGWNAQGIFGL